MRSGQNVGRQTLMTPEVSSITHHVQGSRNDPVSQNQPIVYEEDYMGEADRLRRSGPFVKLGHRDVWRWQ